MNRAPGYSPLSPTQFLERSAAVFADRTAIIDGDLRLTYRDFAERCRALSGVLADFGIGPDDRVAALCSNSHVLLELHNGVPFRGAVLVAINTRLDLAETCRIVTHSGARLLVASAEFAERAADVAARCRIPLLVEGPAADGYDALIASASPAPVPITDENSCLAVNYTSGTTGQPKGVMYHHRGAYLQALAMAHHSDLVSGSRYLWTLPMFHCNGWCFTWAVTAAGAVHVCLRTMTADTVWESLRNNEITHLCGAPTVLRMVLDVAPDDAVLARPVLAFTGGAPPAPALLLSCERLGLDVRHLYGMTETFGPIILNEWQPEWNTLDPNVVARLKARQGVNNIVSARARVVDAAGEDVPADGVTVGEIVVTGNTVMTGYFQDPDATREVFRDGFLSTGDLAVRHPDGYLEIRDRRKDIIVSGGENIASIEVERALEAHPAVAECAVIAAPDEHWGEVVVAYVVAKLGVAVDSDELRGFLRGRIAAYKIPKRVVFEAIPKTSTGKVQKHVLRARQADSGSSGYQKVKPTV